MAKLSKLQKELNTAIKVTPKVQTIRPKNDGMRTGGTCSGCQK